MTLIFSVNCDKCLIVNAGCFSGANKLPYHLMCLKVSMPFPIYLNDRWIKDTPSGKLVQINTTVFSALKHI